MTVSQGIRELEHAEHGLLHAVIFRIDTPEDVVHGNNHIVTLGADLIDVFFGTIDVFIGLNLGHFTEQVDIAECGGYIGMEVVCNF